jgi:hypothetical protein
VDWIRLAQDRDWWRAVVSAVMNLPVSLSFVWFSLQTVIISLNSINQLIFVMVKCCVLFEVRTELLSTI